MSNPKNDIYLLLLFAVWQNDSSSSEKEDSFRAAKTQTFWSDASSGYITARPKDQCASQVYARWRGAIPCDIIHWLCMSHWPVNAHLLQIVYSQRVVIRIAQSTNRIVANATGQGSEPKVEFSSTLVEFGPVLPHSNGDEQELIVKNPCNFPIELYSLEFDKQYLEEEKVRKQRKNKIYFHRLTILWMSRGKC